MCRIARSRASGVIRLHSANTGLCEGVLGSEKELVPLVPTHLLKTNERERRRVVELGASISEVRGRMGWDDRCVCMCTQWTIKCVESLLNLETPQFLKLDDFFTKLLA